MVHFRIDGKTYVADIVLKHEKEATVEYIGVKGVLKHNATAICTVILQDTCAYKDEITDTYFEDEILEIIPN